MHRSAYVVKTVLFLQKSYCSEVSIGVLSEYTIKSVCVKKSVGLLRIRGSLNIPLTLLKIITSWSDSATSSTITTPWIALHIQCSHVIRLCIHRLFTCDLFPCVAVTRSKWWMWQNSHAWSSDKTAFAMWQQTTRLQCCSVDAFACIASCVYTLDCLH